MPKNIMVVYGTRPEAIKVAPVIKAIEQSPDLAVTTVVTGQHREMLDQVNGIFDIAPEFDLDVFEPGQSLNALCAKIFTRLDNLLGETRPDAVLVQGDTTSVAASAIASFNRQVPVIHLEAGLRSGDLLSPFPEEANRRLTSQITRLHLAPTSEARANLLRDGIASAAITVTGNTVIDALMHVTAQAVPVSDPAIAAAIAAARPIVLVTTHRRENWGEPMERIGRAVAQLAREFPEHLFVLPLHRNPAVREAVMPAISGVPNAHPTEPLDYGEFASVMSASSLILTDSGGVQEEAPSLGKPVLVLRDNTERPEAVRAGTVQLIGTSFERITAVSRTLLTDREAYSAMAHATNPYGDGRAAARTAAAIRDLFGLGHRLPDFDA